MRMRGGLQEDEASPCQALALRSRLRAGRQVAALPRRSRQGPGWPCQRGPSCLVNPPPGRLVNPARPARWALPGS